MRLKWCSVGLVTAALLLGVVWYWHAIATSFSDQPTNNFVLPPSINREGLSREEYEAARVSWRAYRRLHDAIDLILRHATMVVATAAAISLIGWAGQAAIRSIGKAPASVASRAVAALRSAPALLGAILLLYWVAVGIAIEFRRAWLLGAPHPAVHRLRQLSDAREALAWHLENGMTTAEVSAAIPDHELKPKAISEDYAALLQGLPSGYQDTDSFYELNPRERHGNFYLRLQFRDDRLINFDSPEWAEYLRTVLAGTEEFVIAVAQ